jgi:uncharacterized protein with PIN domain
MKNWNNLKEKKCPNCESKLRLKIKGNVYAIKANENKKKRKEMENMYTCSICDGFQITETRLYEITKDIEKKEMEEFKKNPLFQSGLLKL